MIKAPSLFPLEFDLRDEQGRCALTLGTEPQILHLEARNRSGRAIPLTPRRGREFAPLTLAFRPGILVDPGRVAAIEEDDTTWTTAAGVGRLGDVLIRLLPTHGPREIGDGQTLRLRLSGLRTDPRGGARQTQVELRGPRVAAGAPESSPWIRTRPLSILPSSAAAPADGGLPLDVTLVDSTEIVGDGVSPSSLTLRVAPRGDRGVPLHPADEPGELEPSRFVIELEPWTVDNERGVGDAHDARWIKIADLSPGWRSRDWETVDLGFDRGQGGPVLLAPFAEELRLGGSFTVQAWVRWNASETSQILSFGGTDAGGQLDRGLQFRCHGVDRRFFTLRTGDSFATSCDTRAEVGHDRPWVHLAATYDRSANPSRGDTAFRLWIDGVLTEAPSYSMIPYDPNTSEPLFVGGDGFHGAVRDIRIWDCMRTTEEIRRDMDGDPPERSQGLVFHEPRTLRFGPEATVRRVVLENRACSELSREHPLEVTLTDLLTAAPPGPVDIRVRWDHLGEDRASGSVTVQAQRVPPQGD